MVKKQCYKGVCFLFCGFLTVFNSLSSEPWGKDADLVCPIIYEPPPKPRGILGNLSEVVINFHHNVISPADGPRSHYYPSSSHYMQDAIHRYGFFKGYIMGCDRLLRENPEEWVYPYINHPERGWTKYNPVP